MQNRSGVGHVPVHRLYEPGSAAVRQLAAQPLIDEPDNASLGEHKPGLTYEDLFDARCACRHSCWRQHTTSPQPSSPMPTQRRNHQHGCTVRTGHAHQKGWISPIRPPTGVAAPASGTRHHLPQHATSRSCSTPQHGTSMARRRLSLPRRPSPRPPGGVAFEDDTSTCKAQQTRTRTVRDAAARVQHPSERGWMVVKRGMATNSAPTQTASPTTTHCIPVRRCT